MAGLWDFLKKDKDDAGNQSAADSSTFQAYTTHPQENKTLRLETGIEKRETVYQQEVPREVPQVPRQQQFTPQLRQSLQQRALTGQAQRTFLPAGIEKYRYKDGYDVNLYVQENRHLPIIAGFKKQFVSYTDINVSADPDINAGLTYASNKGYIDARGLPKKHTTVLHQFDLTAPVGTPDGIKLYGTYRRLNTWDEQIDRMETETELYTDYSLDGRPHRYFVGIATYKKLDGTRDYTRAMMVPAERIYSNRDVEQQECQRWMNPDTTPGDDEVVKLPQLESLPDHLRRIAETYPGLLFGR